jgi:Ubiquitin family
VSDCNHILNLSLTSSHRHITALSELHTLTQRVGHVMSVRALQYVHCVDSSVEYLKDKVFDVAKIPHDHQKFIYAGEQLDDDGFISDYSVQHNAQLHMASTLRGC